jgi:hypothetical protein
MSGLSMKEPMLSHLGVDSRLDQENISMNLRGKRRDRFTLLSGLVRRIQYDGVNLLKQFLS